DIPRSPTPTRFPYTTLFRSPSMGPRSVVHDLAPAIRTLLSRGKHDYSVRVRPGAAAGEKRLRFCVALLAIVATLTTAMPAQQRRSEEHTSELQSRVELVCRL